MSAAKHDYIPSMTVGMCVFGAVVSSQPYGVFVAALIGLALGIYFNRKEPKR